MPSHVFGAYLKRRHKLGLYIHHWQSVPAECFSPVRQVAKSRAKVLREVKHSQGKRAELQRKCNINTVGKRCQNWRRGKNECRKANALRQLTICKRIRPIHNSRHLCLLIWVATKRDLITLKFDWWEGRHSEKLFASAVPQVIFQIFPQSYRQIKTAKRT